MIDPWSWVKGDSRGPSPTPLGLGSQRQLQTATVELEECVKEDPEISTFSGINISHLWTQAPGADRPRIINKMGTFRGSIKTTRTGPCDVRIEKRMHGTLPWIFAPLAPAIDWHIFYDLHITNRASGGVEITGTITGNHDGFPAYEFYVQNRLLHTHDPRRTGDSVFSLFPTMEYSVNRTFIVIDPSGKLKCCECKKK
jgi:hypothetical protein